MSCEYFRELISARLDGELSKEEEEKLTEHLQSCAECQKFASELNTFGELAESSEIVTMPSSIENEILKKTVGKIATGFSLLDYVRGYYRIPRGLIWASMLAVMFLVADRIYQPFESDMRTPVVKIEPIRMEQVVRKVIITVDDKISSSSVGPMEEKQ